MSLFSAVADFLKPTPPLDQPTLDALDLAARMVEPVLRFTPGFEKHLSGPLQHALTYCDSLVGAIPGPIEISRQAFALDPLVHAMFATANDVDQMLGRSQAVRDFLAGPQCWESDYFYAMFAARRQQKKQLGMEQQGELIRNDVPQQVLYFSGQTLVEPHCQIDHTRRGLRRKALESLLHTFHSHIEALRHERAGLSAELAVERAHLAVLRGTSGGQEITVGTRRLSELDARLRRQAEALMPEQLIAALADYLSTPEPALHLTPVAITVDRLGIIRDEADSLSNIHTLNFPELTARDRRLHLAMLAIINRDEALEAVEKVRDQQHRFLLI